MRDFGYSTKLAFLFIFTISLRCGPQAKGIEITSSDAVEAIRQKVEADIGYSGEQTPTRTVASKESAIQHGAAKENSRQPAPTLPIPKEAEEKIQMGNEVETEKSGQLQSEPIGTQEKQSQSSTRKESENLAQSRPTSKKKTDLIGDRPSKIIQAAKKKRKRRPEEVNKGSGGLGSENSIAPVDVDRQSQLRVDKTSGEGSSKAQISVLDSPVKATSNGVFQDSTDSKKPVEDFRFDNFLRKLEWNEHTDRAEIQEFSPKLRSVVAQLVYQEGLAQRFAQTKNLYLEILFDILTGKQETLKLALTYLDGFLELEKTLIHNLENWFTIEEIEDLTADFIRFGTLGAWLEASAKSDKTKEQLERLETIRDWTAFTHLQSIRNKELGKRA